MLSSWQGSRCGFSLIYVKIFYGWMLHFFEESLLVWPFRHQSFNLPRAHCPRVFHPIHEEENADIDEQFSCPCLKANGEQCRATFSTQGSLAVHISNTQGSTHGTIPNYRKLTSQTNAFFANTCSAVCAQQRTTSVTVSRWDAAKGRVVTQFSLPNLQRVCSVLFAIGKLQVWMFCWITWRNMCSDQGFKSSSIFYLGSCTMDQWELNRLS